MSAATIAAIGIAAYPLIMSAYLFVSSDRIRWDMFFAVSEELRSDLGGRSEEADRSRPLSLSAPAGVERRDVPHHVAAPPAPCPLVGAVGRQTAAPTRPPRVAVHG